MAKHQRTTTSPWRWVISGAIAVALVAASGLYLASRLPPISTDANVSIRPTVAVLPVGTAGSFVFPSQGSAAVSVPDAQVRAATSEQPEVPIASLTKMMTAEVALELLPLSLGQPGPCLRVTPDDVAEYVHDRATDQSTVRVVVGDQLCERQLLDGLFVHSASNYATMLVRLTGLSMSSFIDQMNHTAIVLTMNHTTYADVSGYDPSSTSTALDQLRLAEHVMQWPVVANIVQQTTVTLPGAGTVGTYTPLLGVNGVVGIKSGRTSQAGGCDALALRRTVNGTTFLTFAVVLSQHGGDVLAAAGNAAYALADSAAAQVVGRTWVKGQRVGSVGWPGFSQPLVVGTTVSALWLASQSESATYGPLAPATHYAKGDVVGTLILSGPAPRVVSLVAGGDVSPPSWWERLR